MNSRQPILYETTEQCRPLRLYREECGHKCNMADSLIWLFTQGASKDVSFPKLVVDEMSTFTFDRQA